MHNRIRSILIRINSKMMTEIKRRLENGMIGKIRMKKEQVIETKG